MMQREGEMVFYITEKESKLSLILSTESWKFWVLDLDLKESSIVRRARQLDCLKDLECSFGEGLTWDFASKAPKLTWLLKKYFTQCYQ